MKTVHRKIEENIKGIDLKKPITRLMFSDPSYNKDVWCRYENRNLNLSYVHAFKITEHHVMDDYEFDSESVCCVLRGKHYKGEEPDEVKEYEVGVDTGCYVMKSNFNYDLIKTMGDGSWGSVEERYFGGKIGEIVISLGVPDDAMSSKEFLKSLYSIFEAQVPKFKVIEDKDILEEQKILQEVEVPSMQG